MPKLKILSGKEVIQIFLEFNFKIVNQKGSHVKLKRILDEEIKQTLTIPNHSELDKGTVKAVYRQAQRYISEIKLRKYFYLE
ncbi:MAG: type II toxin-antitoxin system HicA family toxin [Patescibacteria group bacterium]